MSQATEDPGWRAASRGLLFVPVLPILFALWRSKTKREPRLILLRTVFVAVSAGLPLLLWSVAALGIEPDEGVPWWGWILLAYPIVGAVIFARSSRAKVLAAETLEAAAARFLAGSFILLALACSPALFGHSLVYLGGGTPAAVVGTAESAVMLLAVAPSRSRLVDLEAQLAERSRPAAITAQLMLPQPVHPA